MRHPVADSTGFRPAARRRHRIAAGLALGAVAVGGNVVIYSSLNDRDPVVQVVQDIPAGELITPDMIRTVEADLDGSVNVIAGRDLDTVVGRYAKVRLISGSLVTSESLQSEPLVSPGHAVVAIQVEVGELPIGLRERVPVRLVIPADRTTEQTEGRSYDGRAVGLPVRSSDALRASVSVEVVEADAAPVASAERVRIVLLVPTSDPARASVVEEQQP